MNGRGLLRNWGLSARIVAFSLLLLLLIQAAVFSVIRVSIDQSARQQIAQELQVGERVWRRLLDQNALKLAQGATLLAADFGFRSAVSTGDVDTIRSALDNHGARIGATVTALIDNSLNLTAVGQSQSLQVRAPDTRQQEFKQIYQRLARAPQSGQIAMIDQVPHQFVMVQVRAPTPIGWVLMGFPIGQSLLDEMRTLSEMHIALISPNANAAPTVLMSTLPANATRILKESRGPITELVVGSDTLVALDVKLDAGPDELHTLLLRSFDEVVAPFRRAQFALAWITALGVALFGIGSVFLARKVTTPLRSLVSATEKLAKGDYATPMEHMGRKDEIGGLATAFDQMRVSIGAQQSEIRRLAYWDHLTGLPNRARFREAAREAIERAGTPSKKSSDQLSIVVLDLDRFKHVNDALGYTFGDSVLQAVAKRLAVHEKGPNDLLARLGGNEFALLLNHTDSASAYIFAQRVASSFEEPLTFADQSIDLSAGIGIACWPEHATDADTLLGLAEVAMYAAKSKTTGVQIYQSSLDSSSTQSLSLLTELRHAVEHNELRLYLQPKIELNLSAATAVEALVRWQHPTRGLVPPLEFIPFAEQTGFVRQLTLWIFNEAARVWPELQKVDQACQIAVNLSARDLMDPALPGNLQAILKTHNVPASGFCLEITESAIMDDPQRAEATLNRLNECGFKLSIDDFGTGYSSLAYLKRLPVDQLKIDKSFVMAMERVKGDAVIVRSTIDLAHNLSLTVVAEGVENAVVYNLLKKLGCDQAQGYLISKPMPAADYVAWRERWNHQLDTNRRESGLSIPIPLY
jgi:diguanylate cyclase (GGDEF)-like protein